MSRGKFIYIFGIDGSGKTTLLKNLEKKLSSQFQSRVVSPVKNFTHIKELEEIAGRLNMSRRECFSETIRGNIWAVELVNTSSSFIEPQLEQNKIVLIDRYTICNYVYTKQNKVSTTTIENIHRAVVKPDVFIYLDTDCDIAYRRILNRGKKISPKEMPEKLLEAKVLYDRYIKEKNINAIRINGNLDEETVLTHALESLNAQFGEVSYGSI
ncbi:dTMP kinase [Bacillus cereus]|uniref:dTMP kinase n=1 Tax=Bacillus sp. BB56-3 TaxID=2217831 RepID=UPI0015D2AFE0|nr:dTMP kinase [Bacillus sp. BB56-3]MCU4759617.1 dTMP kinase [Bacillus cereus]